MLYFYIFLVLHVRKYTKIILCNLTCCYLCKAKEDIIRKSSVNSENLRNSTVLCTSRTTTVGFSLGLGNLLNSTIFLVEIYNLIELNHCYQTPSRYKERLCLQDGMSKNYLFKLCILLSRISSRGQQIIQLPFFFLSTQSFFCFFFCFSGCRVVSCEVQCSVSVCNHTDF